MKSASLRFTRCPTVIILYACIACLNAAAQVNQPAQAELIALPPLSQNGIFDPSLADTGPTARAWMSYSAVDPSPRWPNENTRTETTRLAYSDDHGATWKDLGYRVNDIKEVQLRSKRATWVNEVSSLVYDPGASTAERWQLYWHHYMSIGDKGQFANGWIGYKAAATPEGLATAKEIKLFGGRVYDKDNNDPAHQTRSPVAGPPILQLDRLHDDLSYCLALSEPGAMATSTGIYLSMGCIQPKIHSVAGMLGIGMFGVTGKTILLKCDAPCHPANPTAWKYISTLLEDEDARSFGYKGFAAPDLFTQESRAYLLISPTSDTPVQGSYNGCFVLRFTDLTQGKLARAADGRLEVVKEFRGRPGTFNGDCTYQSSVSASGFMYGEITFTGKPFFQIFQTGPNR
jgi:hypothetical protein